MDIGLSTADLAAAAGYAGVVTSIIWALFKNRTTILVVQLIGSLLFCVHWALLGAQTALVMTAVSVAQVAAAIPLGHRPSFRYVYIATVPVTAVLMAATWNGLPSFLAMLGTAVLSVGRYQVNTMALRVILLIAGPFWFAHNAMVGSTPGMVSDSLSFLVNGVTILRMLAEQRGARAPVAAPCPCK